MSQKKPIWTTTEAHKRLKEYCKASGRTQLQVVSELILQNLASDGTTTSPALASAEAEPAAAAPAPSAAAAAPAPATEAAKPAANAATPANKAGSKPKDDKPFGGVWVV